ncbi:hypothetical protein [Pelagibius sp.]|uniref:hypothetical protein n=1 Tax=Pelagibius sp. TaxID=1931238 RepID=UPI003B5116E4
MKPSKPVSPYLQRPLRSLQEVLRGRRAYRHSGQLVSGSAHPPGAHNSNAPDAVYRASKSA